MAIQITIIGLGQIGSSIGMALAKIKDQAIRIGNDREPNVSRQAEKMGAVDKIQFNLPSAVREADIVIMALPVDEIYETMKIFAQDLKPGSVLIDTSPVVSQVMDWAKELMPSEDRYFISLTPSLNPAYLMAADDTTADAHADLFHNSVMLLTGMPGIDDSAITLATNLVSILGATPMFSDRMESDGLLSYSHLLPQLVAAALANTSIDQPGWREARKIAGRTFARMTEPALHPYESKELGAAALLNSENTSRMLDQMISNLSQMRDAIRKQDAAALKERLDHARTSRTEWWQQRFTANWEPRPGSNVRIPQGGEMIGRLFGLRPKKDKDKK